MSNFEISSCRPMPSISAAVRCGCWFLLATSAGALDPTSVKFGDDVTAAVQERVRGWFEEAPDLPAATLAGASFVVGNRSAAAALIPDDEVAALSSTEGFVARSSASCGAGDADDCVLAIRGGSARGNSFVRFRLCPTPEIDLS